MKADNESLGVDLQQANATITKSSSMTLTEGGHKGKHTRHNPERSDLMMQLIAIGAKKTILPLVHVLRLLGNDARRRAAVPQTCQCC